MELDQAAPALKLLANQLSGVQACEEGGAFRLGALPPFDRVWVQGTVQRKVAGSLKLDDGTGVFDCTVGGAAPGVEADTVVPGAFVLLIGKLQCKREGGGNRFNIKALKLVNLSKQCGEGVGQRMMHWSLEVAELQSMLEAAAA